MSNVLRKSHNFVLVNSKDYERTNISWVAKGVYAYISTRPQGHDLDEDPTIKELLANEETHSAIDELIAVGLVHE